MSDPAEVIEPDELEQDATPEIPLRPPKAGATKAPTPPKRRGRPKKPDSLEQPIKLMLATIGGVWSSTEASRGHPDPTCGAVLVAQSAAIAKTLNAVAMEDESVYRWLSAMMTGGGWGAVAFATLPVVQAVVASHVVPAIERRRLYAVEETEGEAWQPPNEIPPDESPPGRPA